TLGYKLYGIVSAAKGQALPLAFVFTTSTNSSTEEEGKEYLLQQVLQHIAAKCPVIKFILIDKDLSKINS
ncbi:hypothetical protein F5146DRAFT_902066, partial [Armillaria mellea]